MFWKTSTKTLMISGVSGGSDCERFSKASGISGVPCKFGSSCSRFFRKILSFMVSKGTSLRAPAAPFPTTSRLSCPSVQGLRCVVNRRPSTSLAPRHGLSPLLDPRHHRLTRAAFGPDSRACLGADRSTHKHVTEPGQTMLHCTNTTQGRQIWKRKKTVLSCLFSLLSSLSLSANVNTKCSSNGVAWCVQLSLSNSNRACCQLH